MKMGLWQWKELGERLIWIFQYCRRRRELWLWRG